MGSTPTRDNVRPSMRAMTPAQFARAVDAGILPGALSMRYSEFAVTGIDVDAPPLLDLRRCALLPLLRVHTREAVAGGIGSDPDAVPRTVSSVPVEWPAGRPDRHIAVQLVDLDLSGGLIAARRAVDELEVAATDELGRRWLRRHPPRAADDGLRSDDLLLTPAASRGEGDEEGGGLAHAATVGIVDLVDGVSDELADAEAVAEAQGLCPEFIIDLRGLAERAVRRQRRNRWSGRQDSNSAVTGRPCDSWWSGAAGVTVELELVPRDQAARAIAAVEVRVGDVVGRWYDALIERLPASALAFLRCTSPHSPQAVALDEDALDRVGAAVAALEAASPVDAVLQLRGARSAAGFRLHCSVRAAQACIRGSATISNSTAPTTLQRRPGPIDPAGTAKENVAPTAAPLAVTGRAADLTTTPEDDHASPAVSIAVQQQLERALERCAALATERFVAAMRPVMRRIAFLGERIAALESLVQRRRTPAAAGEQAARTLLSAIIKKNFSGHSILCEAAIA